MAKCKDLTGSAVKGLTFDNVVHRAKILWLKFDKSPITNRYWSFTSLQTAFFD